MYEDNSYTKYNNYNDIKFGTEQLQLNFENVYKDKSLYLIDGGDVIYQSNKLNFEFIVFFHIFKNITIHGIQYND